MTLRHSARARAVGMVLLVAASVAGCSDSPESAGVPVLIDREPDEITEIVAVGRDGRRAHLRRGPEGTWTPSGATALETGSIMFSAQGHMFPLRAYRKVRIDLSNPEFGLTDPEVVLSAKDRQGRTHQVRIGASTFNGEGFYARTPSSNDDAVYLVPRRVMSDLRSLVAGRAIDVAHPVDQKFEEIAERAERAPEQPDRWLAQALDHGAELPAGAR